MCSGVSVVRLLTWKTFEVALIIFYEEIKIFIRTSDCSPEEIF